jgi:alpha-acetolactate decarboxylase
LLGALLAQFANKFAHLIAGGTVNSFDGGVACSGVCTCGDIGIATFLVSAAQLTVFVTQAFDAGLELALESFLVSQFAKDPLYVALTVFELLLIFIQVCRLLAP